MRRERHAAGEECRTHLPHFRHITERGPREDHGRRRPDEGMHSVPGAVDQRHLVGDELDDEHRECDADDDGIGEDIERRRQVYHAEPLEQAGRRDGSVEVEPRRERRTQGEAERLEWGHGLLGSGKWEVYRQSNLMLPTLASRARFSFRAALA